MRSSVDLEAPSPAEAQPAASRDVRLGVLADAATVSRILLTPVFLAAAEAARREALRSRPSGAPRAGALLLLLGVAASDRLDGSLARRSGRAPSRHGAILDAVADRFAQWSGTLWLALRAGPVFTPVPRWFPLVLGVREAVLLGSWLRRQRPRNPEVEHETHGRAATVLVFGLLGSATAGLPSRLVSRLAAAAGAAVLYSTARYALRMRR